MTLEQHSLSIWLTQNKNDLRAVYMLVYGETTGQIIWEQLWSSFTQRDYTRVVKDIRQLILDADDTVSKNNADVLMLISDMVEGI
jgi:hypothetical protein